eukprot:CAMPEP_0113232290 /NCGR_PEP_ID=MMETSP0008_2-20120614/1870_1 /TAXON_ID=97485 /ORGANISM="Prymnesium parvum" /LENGTH=41 /DNA_ID=CAMNT_0000078993 /DNA_START=629 /DNA_END=754 /DNA_ORIENTATION=+ /assembly_acc=CAM_ASM_000153
MYSCCASSLRGWNLHPAVSVAEGIRLPDTAGALHSPWPWAK